MFRTFKRKLAPLFSGYLLKMFNAAGDLDIKKMINQQDEGGGF